MNIDAIFVALSVLKEVRSCAKLTAFSNIPSNVVTLEVVNVIGWLNA